MEKNNRILIVESLPGIFLLKIPFEIKDDFKENFETRFVADSKTWTLKEMDIPSLEHFAKERGLELIILHEAKEHYFQMQDAIAMLRNKEEVETDLPFNDVLRPYQKVGIKFLSSYGNKILADEMGLGKSVQLIGTLKTLNADRYLIVVPNSLKYSWLSEFKKWLPNEDIVVVEGTKEKRREIIKNSKKLIINYEMLLNEDYLELLKGFDVIVYDESTFLKNRKAKRTQNAFSIKADKILMATGTPITKTPADLFAQLHILFPQIYDNFWAFASKYCIIDEMRIAGREIKKVYGVKNEDELKERLKGVVIRREQSEVAQYLPEFIEEEIILDRNDMSEEQRSLYVSLEESLERETDRNTVLKYFTFLFEALESPANLQGYEDGTSIKMRALMELIDTFGISNRSYIIWTHFVRTADVVNALLNKIYPGKVGYISGLVSPKERERIIREFNEGLINFLVITISTGKFGFNITPKNPVASIFVSRSYSFEDMEQAKMRTKRLSSTHSTVVFYLHVANTVDDLVKESLETKKDIFEVIFSKKGVRK